MDMDINSLLLFYSRCSARGRLAGRRAKLRSPSSFLGRQGFLAGTQERLTPGATARGAGIQIEPGELPITALAAASRTVSAHRYAQAQRVRIPGCRALSTN